RGVRGASLGLPPGHFRRRRFHGVPGDRTKGAPAERRPMRPITFTCRETLPLSPADIAGQILDVAKWPEFTGYGPIPGIKSAEFEARTPEVVGTRIRVTNTDGSTHVEEIIEWQPDARLVLHTTDFSPPLARLAARLVEGG